MPCVIVANIGGGANIDTVAATAADAVRLVLFFSTIANIITNLFLQQYSQ